MRFIAISFSLPPACRVRRVWLVVCPLYRRAAVELWFLADGEDSQRRCSRLLLSAAVNLPVDESLIVSIKSQVSVISAFLCCHFHQKPSGDGVPLLAIVVEDFVNVYHFVFLRVSMFICLRPDYITVM